MTVARLHLALVILLATAATTAQSAPRFDEDLILANDRAAVIATLVPTSEDAFFHRALHSQQRGLLNEAAAELDAWREVFPRESLRRRALENRQALLRFAVDPEVTYTHLIERLHPTLDHQRSAAAEARALPTRIEPSQLSLSALTQATLAADGSSLDRFSDAALPRLMHLDLSDAQREQLVVRLKRHDVPGLVDAILRDFEKRPRAKFQDRAVHAMLTLAQLEELAQRRPALLASRAFAEIFAQRLAPADHIDVERNDAERRAWLTRLEALTTRLPSTLVSMEANILYHRLIDDERRGVYDRERFVRFLRIPTSHSMRTSVQRGMPREESALTHETFVKGLGAIGDQGKFVHRMLMHFLAREASVAGFSDFIDGDILRDLQAEAKILAGSDDDTWFAQLSTEKQQALRERVEISFAPTQKRTYAANDDVTLELDVKNVGAITVAVYDIDVAGLSYALHAQMSLDGLVPHSELTIPVDAPAQRRVRLDVPVPALSRPGSYIVDVIGNGLANRAVIQKGRLDHLSELTASGHHVRIFSESGEHLRDATLTIERRTFRADEDGVIVVPYTDERRAVDAVLEHGRIATRDSFTFEEEHFALRAGIWVDREALAGTTATLVMRPTLTLNDNIAPLDLLSDVTLTLTAQDVDGIKSTDILRGITLEQNGEFTHEFGVPDNIASLHASVSARVELQSGEKTTIRSAGQSIAVNAVLLLDDIATPLLVETPEGWVVDVLGRNGEGVADAVVDFELFHRDFNAALPFRLRSDANGRITLGSLPNIERVRPIFGARRFTAWALDGHESVVREQDTRAQITAVVGEEIEFPWTGADLNPLDVTLLELRGGFAFADRFSHLTLRDGLLVATGLSAGSYLLDVRSMDLSSYVIVTPGERRDDLVVGTRSITSTQPSSLLRIHPIEVDGDDVVIRVGGVSPSTRLHVFANRFAQAHDIVDRLARMTPASQPSFTRDIALSTFNSTRPLSDEERYVLARRKLTPYAGNMLDRPSLLVNPLALTSLTSFDSSGFNDVIGVGGGAGSGFGKLGRRGSGGRRAGKANLIPTAEASAELRFLAGAPMLRLDVPINDGVARIPRAGLGSRHVVHAVAIDELAIVSRRHALPEPPLALRDRRLAESLPTDRPVIQRQRFDVLEAGDAVSIDRETTPRYDLVDSLASVYRLQRSLCDDTDLGRFAFLVRWPDLSLDEKLDHLSRFACHELHIFLREKDRPFFDEHVRPTVADKRRLDFIDRWLLDEDLTEYTDSWKFSQLNAAEKALLARALPERRDATRRWIDERAAKAASGRAIDTLFAGSALIAASAEEFEELAPPAADEVDAAFEFTPHKSKKSPRLWRTTPALRKFVEHRYWARPDAQASTPAIAPSRFWSDFAATDAGASFVSTALSDATRNVSECILALAFTDLPFLASEHERSLADTTLSITLAHRALVAREDIVAEERAIESNGLVIGETFVTRGETGRVPVRDEFVIGTPYVVQAVLTNPTSNSVTADVLVQIPAGAIPLAGGRTTVQTSATVGAFGTETISQFFYFPAVVPASVTPAQAAVNGVPIARAEITALPVVAERTQVDTTTWEHIAQNASLDEVLTALEAADLATTNLVLLAWRMSDSDAFRAITNALRTRFVFDATLWGYALQHRDERATAEFLSHNASFVTSCGGALTSPLLTIEPELRGMHQHVEYAPLFRGRFHDRPGAPRFSTEKLQETWSALLHELSWKTELDDIDHLDLTWWLLLQDRVPDALSQFGKVDTNGVGLSTQIEYLRAYFAMSSGEPAAAREFAQPHVDHPLAHWRERFRDVVAHADEAEGKTADNEDDAPEDVAAAAPSLHVSIDAGKVVVEHENIGEYELSFTPVDIELLFSSKPFESTASGRRMVTRPLRSQIVAAEGSVTRTPLPEEYRNRNALVQVRAAGLVDRASSEAHSMSVRIAESQGELKVMDEATREPLPATYVKVYAMLADGSTTFYKDGYTDLRGRFDYSLRTAQVASPVKSFAILVVSSDHGATRREVNAPLR